MTSSPCKKTRRSFPSSGPSRRPRAAQIFQSTNFNESGLVLASLFFLVLTIPMTRFTDHLIARDRARRLVATT